MNICIVAADTDSVALIKATDELLSLGHSIVIDPSIADQIIIIPKPKQKLSLIGAAIDYESYINIDNYIYRNFFK